MKVVCINTGNREKLTLNQVYEVEEFYFGYRIIDNSHDQNSFCYPKNLFITLAQHQAQYREKQIDSIFE